MASRVITVFLLAVGGVVGCASKPDRPRSPGRSALDSGIINPNVDSGASNPSVDSGALEVGVADSGVFTPPRDTGVSNPPPNTPASLRITEINPASRTDLIELIAVGAGALDGIAIHELTNSGFRYTFPDGYTVARNDVIMLHLNGACTDDAGDKTSCGGTAPVSSRAWDFSMRGALSYSGKAFVLIAEDGAMIDGVPFVESGGAVPSSYATAVRQLQAAGLWDATPCVDDQTTGFARDRYCRNISVIWDSLEEDNRNSVTRIAGATPLAVPGQASAWSAALPATWGSYPRSF